MMTFKFNIGDVVIYEDPNSYSLRGPTEWTIIKEYELSEREIETEGRAYHVILNEGNKFLKKGYMTAYYARYFTYAQKPYDPTQQIDAEDDI